MPNGITRNFRRPRPISYPAQRVQSKRGWVANELADLERQSHDDLSWATRIVEPDLGNLADWCRLRHRPAPMDDSGIYFPVDSRVSTMENIENRVRIWIGYSFGSLENQIRASVLSANSPAVL